MNICVCVYANVRVCVCLRACAVCTYLGIDSLLCTVQDFSLNKEMDAVGQITAVNQKDDNLTFIEFADGTLPNEYVTHA